MPKTVVFWRIAVDHRRFGAHASLQDGQGLWHQGHDRSQRDVSRETRRIPQHGQNILPRRHDPVVDFRAEEHRLFGTGARQKRVHAMMFEGLELRPDT
ncbi:hypothetical protein [Bradyrhizobium sp. STM 3557]|uniref:hypothetical protein n=1 Tax=Bradyrhizobium sp. STM 3557 TaxID=578920 RepID=UPI00388F1CBB